MFVLALSRPDSHDRKTCVCALIKRQCTLRCTQLFSSERIFAVHKPSLYNRYFTANSKALLVIFTAILQLVSAQLTRSLASLALKGSLAWAALSALHNELETSTQHCAIISSTSIAFSTFHFTFVVFAYVVSFCSLSVVYMLHRVGGSMCRNF